MAFLAVDDLHVRYGDMVALRGVSLKVKEGEIVCVIGPNGAGKSTLLATIAGGVKPSQGGVTYAGQAITGTAPEKIASMGVSLVPEGRHIFGTLTVAENLMIGAYMRRDGEIARDRERILDRLPRLRERISFPAGRLSGGEQQMLAVARAVMTRPKLLLVDEPSLGLAPKIVEEIYAILGELRQTDGLTFIINEQSSNRILKYADRIHVLRHGEIRLEGTAAELADGHAIREAYFGFSEPAYGGDTA